jgi:hypothetical protein
VLTLRLPRPATFALRVRVPAWASPLVVRAAGASITAQSGWASLPAREWKDGERIELGFTLAARLVPGTHGNAGQVAATWGPFVLACGQRQNTALPSLNTLGLVESQPPLVLNAGRELAFDAKVVGPKGGEAATATLTTFADAGGEGGLYRVWLRAPGLPGASSNSLLSDGEESRSRQGNLSGSILADDLASFVVTFDQKRAKEDWFAVKLAQPVTIARVVFAHGKSFHDGGWFDTRGGKPQVQVQRAKNGAWETVGTLSDYPATTDRNGQMLAPGQRFTLHLPSPVSAIAVRVLGVPACGDNPKQAFSSCAALQAMAK